MALDKREKIKFYVVIGLALIFAATAYFRFWHKKDSAAPDRQAAAPLPTEPAVTRIAMDRQVDNQVIDRSKEVTLPLVKRDIFRPADRSADRPAVVTSRSPKRKPAKPKPAPVPGFKLSGTIVSGGEPMAIINDRFLRTGDTIAAFKVVRIETGAVYLVSGNKNIELKMINNE
ncbi:hypothetical protein JY97_02815 [Alkalispirochaeta odontotermitis]|nr:hypothetical protein JY97_02815 [Alkalispirochaeta odontotermitis]CAB1083177.1 hypothetical protein D1AOALGA4SA_10757 [Olavius algarvensis Delta 1 endosymbiont]